MATRTSSLQDPNAAPLSAPGPAGLRMPSSSNASSSSAGYGHAHSKSHSGNTTANMPASAGGMPVPSMDRSVSSVGGLSPSNANAAATALANNAAKIRASLDAARTLYGSTGAQGNPGIGLGHPASPNVGVGGFSSRNTSATSNNAKRPASELLPGGTFNSSAGAPTDADVIDRWFEDLHHYEATLEEMAAASLDQAFKEELGAIEQWFRVLSEAERTAALYSLIQSSSQVQIRFFITVLQQMARTDPMTALLSPANPQQASMEAQMDAKMASLGIKTPVSPAMRQLARQSLNAIPTNTADMSGFLSPHSAMLSQSASPRADSLTIDDPTSSAPDAATRLAQQRAKLSNSYRISAPGALLSASDMASMKSPLWSQANNDSVAERSGRSPSPDSRMSNSGSNNARSRPASMLSDAGLPIAGNSANNLNIPGQDASTGGAQRPAGINTNLSLSIGADGQLSPMMTGQNWAAMMQTPLMTSFSAAALASAGAGGDNSGIFNGFDSQASKRDNAWGTQSAAASAAPNPIALDDARKFRRNARVGDAGADGANGVQGIMSNMYSGVGAQQNGDYGRRAVSAAAATGAQAANQAALSAQQNWRNVNGLNNIQGSPSLGLGSPDLSNNIATLQAAMQNMNTMNNLNNLASPQLAMANLLAAQQQIQQQMQLQQNLLNMTGMSPLGLIGVQNQMQNQQMLSPALGGMGAFGQGGMNGNSFGNRRSPRLSDRGVSGSQNKANLIVPGCGTNPDEPIDMSLLADVPSWLRSLRLHKYTTNFERSNWRDMVMMDDGALEGMGVSALGARRKLLKVFENVRNQQGIPHPPGFDPRAGSPMPGKSDTEE